MKFGGFCYKPECEFLNLLLKLGTHHLACLVCYFMICTLMCNLDEMPNMWISGKIMKRKILYYDMDDFRLSVNIQNIWLNFLMLCGI